MNTGAMSGVIVRKVNRPGKIGGAPIATAVHQTADAAEGMAQRDAGREDVGDFPKRQFFDADIEDAGERRADQSTIITQSAAADVEHLPERLPGKVLAPIGKDEETASAYDRAQDQPWTEVDHRLTANSGEWRAPAGSPEPGKQAECNEHAIPVDGEVAQVKGDFVHVTANLEFAI